jgi:spoIIIJ-associated protein
MQVDLQQTITSFFTDVLGQSPELQVNESPEEIEIHLTLDPSQSGAVIGYRGEVLSAIQLIISLIVQKHTGTWIPVRLDINDYRQLRAQAVETLAFNSAQKAIDTNQPVPLSNLSSYERRLVHTTLSDHPDVVTESQGEAPYRTLVISPRPHAE